MATPPFLVRPQSNIRIMSWNINSVKTKIEKKDVELLLNSYDVICLNEIKTNLPVSFPGYVSYVSYDHSNGNRGGTCVFIRQYLSKEIFDVDMSIADQIWFRLKCIPGVLFGACYIPPADSEYFSYTQLSKIQEKIKTSECGNGCIIIGDMNARLGTSIRELTERLGLVEYSYPFIPDPIPTPNDNAVAIFGICVEEQLLIVNNLKTPYSHYQSRKTFRRGREWTSEIDTCLVSKNLVKFIIGFQVIDNDLLPSDHAPIAIILQPPSVSLESVKLRASELGKHGAEYSDVSTTYNRLTKRSIQFQKIDIDVFLTKLSGHRMELGRNEDIDLSALRISNTLYDCASTSVSHENPIGTLLNNDQSRWDRLLESEGYVMQ